MPASTEPRSGLQWGWDSGESGWKGGVDANWLALGRFLTQLSVIDRDLATPPGSPAAGATYIIGPSPTGAWAGLAGSIAVWTGSAWAIGTPRTGWVAYIEDEQRLSVFRAGAWSTGILI